MPDNHYDPVDGFFAALNDENDFDREYPDDYPFFEDFDNEQQL